MTEAKPSALPNYMSIDEDDFLDDKYMDPAYHNILTLFSIDPQRAKKLAAKLGNQERQRLEMHQQDVDRQIQKNFQKRKIVPATVDIGGIQRKVLTKDPLVDCLPDGKIPSLPPVPEDILPKKEFSDDDDIKTEELAMNMQRTIINPGSKREVGQKFGIVVDVPKSIEPTQFIATMVDPQKPKQQPQQNMMHFQNLPYPYPYQYPYPYPYPYPYAYQYPYPIPEGYLQQTYSAPFTPNVSAFQPHPTETNRPRELLAKQKLMEQSGISIAPPAHPFSPTMNMSPQQKLINSSGITISPPNHGPIASMNVQGMEFQTKPSPSLLPSTVRTSGGVLTIGKVGETDPSSRKIEEMNQQLQKIEMQTKGNARGFL